MKIEFIRKPDGTLMAIDADTGAELGEMETMGDQITEDKPMPDVADKKTK